MLIENSKPSNYSPSIGDSVIVKTLNMYGRVVEFRDGKWVVETRSGKLTEDASNLRPVEVLLG